MNCIEYIAAYHRGRIIKSSISESEMEPGDIACYVQGGNEPCFCIAKDSNRVIMIHEGKEKFVFTTALHRAGYVFLGGLRVG